MHPDKIAIPKVGRKGVRKHFVGFAECSRCLLIEGNLIELVVKKRPDSGVCCWLDCPVTQARRASVLTREAIVVSFCSLLVEQYWNRMVLLEQLFPHVRNVLLRQLDAWPPVP